MVEHCKVCVLVMNRKKLHGIMCLTYIEQKEPCSVSLDLLR